MSRSKVFAEKVCLLHSFRSCESIGGSHPALLLPDLADEIPAASCYSKETCSPHVADRGARHVHPMGWMLHSLLVLYWLYVCLTSQRSLLIPFPIPSHSRQFPHDVFYAGARYCYMSTHSSPFALHILIAVVIVRHFQCYIFLWKLVVIRNVDVYDDGAQLCA